MNPNPPGNRKRSLVCFPIVHTATDMGTLATQIEDRKLPSVGRQGIKHHAAVVDQMWAQIERAAMSLPGQSETVRVYQDGLPVCGHEQQIVEDLAASGSRNHRLLLQLQARGATLMGTESPELLLEEYRWATAAFATDAPEEVESGQQAAHDALLEKRDRFIAERINTTLRPGESGILLLGLLHDIRGFLDPDILVTHPLGSPRTRQGRGA